MRYMESLTKDDLELLMSSHNGPCMSIFMPTHPSGPDIRQDPIRLKNILNQAEQRMIESGMYNPKLQETLIKPALRLVEQEQFWRQQSQGLALFISQDIFEYFRLPINFEELVVIDNSFHIKPLLPMFKGDGKFFILALSQNHVRVLQCTHYTVREIHIRDMPTSMADALKYNDPSGKPTLSHAMGPGAGSGGSTGIQHGQIKGTDADYKRKEILQYFYQVNDCLGEILKHQDCPLILACVENNYHIFKEANTYPHLLDKFIHGSPENISDQQLHDIGWQIVDPLFRQVERDALEKFHQQVNESKDAKWTSNELEDIIPAAYYGQVDILFVAASERQWGKFDPDTNIIYLSNEEKITYTDLLDFAAIQTFLHGGTVYVLPRDQMPDGNRIAALFRYPSAIRTSLTVR